MANHETSLARTCKTCGSEIVETINDSNFREGECGPCEYQRYKSQPKLLEASFLAYGVLCDLSYHRCFRGKSRRFKEANDVVGVLATAVNEAYGEPA